MSFPTNKEYKKPLLSKEQSHDEIVKNFKKKNTFDNQSSLKTANSNSVKNKSTDNDKLNSKGKYQLFYYSLFI